MTGLSPFQMKWSARAAWLTTGVPDRVCRRAIAQGIIPATALRGEHLVALQVFGATEGFPSGADAPSPELLRDRMRVASSAVADCWFQGDESWTLLVTRLDARLSHSGTITTGLLQAYHGNQILILPVGAWCARLKRGTS